MAVSAWMDQRSSQYTQDGTSPVPLVVLQPPAASASPSDGGLPPKSRLRWSPQLHESFISKLAEGFALQRDLKGAH